MDLFGIKKRYMMREQREGKETGIYIDELPDLRENNKKIKGIALNAILNAIIVSTTVISVLEAFDVDYYRGLFCLSIFIICIFAASFYLNIICKIIGYICVIAGFIYGVTKYTSVIRGGFGIIANKFMEVIEVVLDLPIERRYEEYAVNETFAVTLCVIFLGGAFALIFNIIITETKGFVVILCVTFPIAQLGIYFDRQVNVPVFILYFAALTSLLILRVSHYKCETRKKRGYYVKRKKNMYEYDYINHNGNGLSRMVRILAVIFLVATAVTIVYPKNRFAVNKTGDGIKSSTQDFAKRVALVGFWGMLNPNGTGNGGIGRSKLGNADRIRLDYQKDLDVITPVFSDEKQIYLRAYTGTTYEDNNWLYISEKQPKNYKKLSEFGLETSDIISLNSDILAGDSEHLLVKRVKMVYVYNTFANTDFLYVPENAKDSIKMFETIKNDDEFTGTFGYGDGIKCWYYNLDQEMTLGQISSAAEELKKRNSDNKVYETEQKYREYVYNTYLEVPDENRDVINRIFEQYGIKSGDSLNNVYDIIEMFDEYYKYTLMPGKTPSDEDFVNYFLEKSRKGYCSYFASAAVLMFRQLGIPARYAGGYMVSTTDSDYMTKDEYIADNNDGFTAVEGMDTDEYDIYDIEVNDSNAHAWTEVYIDNLGWVPVDVTPSSDDDEDTQDDGGGIENIIGNIFNPSVADGMKNTAAHTFTILMLLICIGGAAGIAVIEVMRRRRMTRLDVSKNLRYLMWVTKAADFEWNRYSVFDRLAQELVYRNICTQEEGNLLISIIEKEKYSDKKVDEQEQRQVNEIVIKISQKIYKDFSLIKKIRYLYLF